MELGGVCFGIELNVVVYLMIMNQLEVENFVAPAKHNRNHEKCGT